MTKRNSFATASGSLKRESLTQSFSGCMNIEREKTLNDKTSENCADRSRRTK